jgi:hypothetical protein
VFPELSPSLQAFIRAGYGLLMLLTLVWAWPHRHRFFLSERWGGYAESRREVDWLHHPVACHVLLTAWVAAAVALVVGRFVIAAALINFALCRYFFVHMRWKGLLRGMGAPGFMAYWLAGVVLVLEYTARHAPAIHSLALLVAQVDFAFIMLSAGIYKWTAGYARGDGMDFGMVNPEWGYWWRIFLRLRPGHALYRFLNQMAWSTEVVAAVLMMLPFAATRLMGGLLIVLSFLLIATQIRLGWLSEMMMLCALLFVPPSSVLDRAVAVVWPATLPALVEGPHVVTAFLTVFLWTYMTLLPMAHAGLFYNLFARRRLHGPWQTLLERYTNLFGLVIWRVFSVDHLNFFVRIYRERPDGGDRELLSHYGSPRSIRFCSVAECIVVTTLFTTLKYFASNRQLFDARLLRYARTLPCSPDQVLVFEYVSVRKSADRFLHVPVVEYIVDPVAETIREVVREAGFDVHAPAATSPVHEGAAPGSYAPAIR